MKAADYSSFDPPETLTIEDVGRPLIQDREVLVGTRCASVNPFDCRFRGGYLPTRLISRGFLKLKWKILGVDVAGSVIAVGDEVQRFCIGDKVFGFAGINVDGCGSHAEYVRVPQSLISAMPDNLSFAEAAAVPLAAVTALLALRDVAAVLPGC